MGDACSELLYGSLHLFNHFSALEIIMVHFSEVSNSDMFYVCRLLGISLVRSCWCMRFF